MNRSFQLIASIALAATPLLSLADTSVGFSNSNASDKFRTLLQESVATHAKTKTGVTLEFQDAKDDTGKQLAQVKALADKKLGAIIILPVNTTTAPLSDAARKAGVPIVYVNNRPSEPLGDGTMFVGSDELMAGRMQGDFIAKKLGGNGTVVILKGPSEHSATLARTKGLKAVLSGHPGMKVTSEITANWKRSEAQAAIADLLKKGEAPSVIAANNDEMALGAVDAITAAGGAASKVLVLGVDATPDALRAVKDGKMAATVLQNAKGQGRAALDLALKMANKEAVPKELMVPFELVTAENLDKYTAK